MAAEAVRINGAQSLYLDFLRGVAALAVVFHHYNHHIARAKDAVFPDVGQEAVLVFFVMSGFVIAMVAERNEHEFSVFARKRLARFVSVVFPVAAILIGAYYITTSLSPGAYEWWGSMDHWPAKLAATLTFSTESVLWHGRTLPGGAPMWSMSFEFWYYFVFAFAVLLASRPVGLLLALVCAIWIGPDGMLLFPIWLMGVAVFHLRKRVTLPPAAAWGCAILGLAGVIALQQSGLRYSLLNTKTLAAYDIGHATYFPYFYLIGICLVAHILGMLRLLDGWQGEPRGFVAAVVRRTAHSAFFLYLTHIPVMFFFKALFGGVGFPYLIPVLAWLVALLVGKPIEYLRFPLQRLIGLKRPA